MPTTIDELQIEINAKASSANAALDNLIDQIDRLSKSLKGFEKSSVSEFGKFINRLEKLSKINITGLGTVTKSIEDLTRAFSNMGAANGAVSTLGNLFKSISKLGNKSITNAITNIPVLATELSKLLTVLSQSPNVSNNVVKLISSISALSNKGIKFSTSSKAMTRGFDGIRLSANRASKSTFSLASAFGKFYASYFLVIRGIKSLWNSIESTTDYIEALNYQTVAFGKIASEWSKDWDKYGYDNAEAYADSFTSRLNETLGKLSGVKFDENAQILSATGLKSLGLNLQEITQFSSQLASVTNSVGQTGEVSLIASTAFTKLAGDISSLFNLDYSSVASNLQSGLLGQSRALYKFGIDITNATLQTYAYGLGLEKTVSEMTQAEKMQLRMLAILDQSKVSWGDLANTINSPSNMIRQFTTNLKECGLVLGQLFLPLLEKVLPVLNGVSIAIKSLLTDIAALMGITINLNAFGQGYADLGTDIDGVTDSLDGLAEATGKAKKGLRGFDELNVINSDKGANSNGLSSVDLTQEIIKASEEYQKVWDEAYSKMENRAQEFANKIGNYFMPIKKIISDIKIGDFFQLGSDTSNLATGIFTFFSNAISGVDWYSVGNNVGLFLSGLNWSEILSSVGKVIWEGLNGAIDAWKGLFDSAPIEATIIAALPFLNIGKKGLFALLGSLPSVVTTVSTSFSSLSAVIGGLSAPVLGLVGGVAALVVGLGAVFATNKDVRDGFFESASAIKDNIAPALELLTGTILPDLKSNFSGIVEMLSPVFGLLSDVFTDLWTEHINPALSDLGTTIIPSVMSAFQGLWNNVLQPVSKLLRDVFTPIIKHLSIAFSILWNDAISPLASAVRELGTKAFSALSDILQKSVFPAINNVIKVFQFLWNKVLPPLYNSIGQVLGPIFVQTFATIKNVIGTLKKSFSGLIDFVTGLFTRDWGRAWNGVVEIFSAIFEQLKNIGKGVVNVIIGFINGMIVSVQDGINFLISAINNLQFDIPEWIPGVGGSHFGLDLKNVSFPEIPYLINGGFVPNTADLFMANENGIPELVGTVGGRTAVASGSEITGIRDAIYNSHAEEMALMRQQNEILMGILSKEFGITQNDIGRAARNYAREYTERTKKPAYSF